MNVFVCEHEYAAVLNYTKFSALLIYNYEKKIKRKKMFWKLI